MQQVFAAHAHNLIKLFLHYAAADAVIDSGDNLTISLDEYILFLKDMQIPNNHCSRRNCIIAFAASQEADPTFIGSEVSECMSV